MPKSVNSIGEDAISVDGIAKPDNTKSKLIDNTKSKVRALKFSVKKESLVCNRK